MSTDQHPALITDHDPLPTLTLVLPPGLGKDQVLAGLAGAIAQVRSDLAGRAQLFQRRVEKYAARGDRLRQAMCRGQVIGGEHAATALDEAIIGVFDLWDQYDAQLSAAGSVAPRPAPSQAQHPGEGLPQ